jgi:hypothetical protein
MKICTKCGTEKPLEAFCKDGGRPDGLYLHCRVCNAAARKTNRQANLERDRRKGKICQAVRRYGISQEDAVRWIEEEVRVGLCEGCYSVAQLDLDHSHVTGKFRGKLCRQCNLTLAFAKDSPARLRYLAEYLERSYEVLDVNAS